MNHTFSNGRLIRSSSLSRLQDEEQNENQSPASTNHCPPQSGGLVPHPGHRYYTPQPAKRKALRPQISTKPQVSQKPQTPPVIEDGTKPQKLTLKIPKRTGTFGNNSLDSGDRSQGDSFDSGMGSASVGVNDTRKALRPPSAQSRTNMTKSMSSTPSTPGSSVFTPDGLRVTPEYSEGDPIQPKRKAPSKPPVGRRKSDPLCNSRTRRKGEDNDDDNSKKRLSRNQTLEGGILPSELEKYAGSSRHRYFTPQPGRRKFNFQPDSPRRKSSGSNSPAAGPKPPPQYTRSPVERLAIQMLNNKQNDRPPSSGTMSPEGSPVCSPVRNPRTPTKPAPLPPTQTPNPEPYDFVTDEEVLDAQRHVGGPRRARSMSSGSMPSMKRRPLPSVPGRPRSGSASKSQDIHTVSSKAIQRKRRNRQSAPAGRVASLLSDSNTSLHHKSIPANTASAPLGEKKRETLRDELLRSLLVENVTKSSTIPIKRTEEPGAPVDVDKANSLQQVENSLKMNMVRQKSGYDECDTSPMASPLPEKSLFDGTSPSPTSSAGNSPTRRPRRRRNKSSLSSLVSMPKSLVASNELLSDILLSSRGSHKKLKAIVGFLVGLILGGLLFLGLYYGLGYSLYPSLAITAVSTIFMALCLAFTVRARCVAALMVPTVCTSRGRAAFLTFIVTLLLRGPIHNIYLNANEVSDSMSCSAQLAYNQTRQIQEAAQRVLDAYVQGLLSSVNRIQGAVEQVQEVFVPVEQGLDILNDGLNQASQALGQAADACNDILGSVKDGCVSELNKVYDACLDTLSQDPTLETISGVCQAFRADVLCTVLGDVDNLCDVPTIIDVSIDNALQGTRVAMQRVIDAVSADVDMSHFFENRKNQSTTSEHIQAAISQELDRVYSTMDFVISISDKLLALTFVWLFVKCYLYHTSYRSRDAFDNQYITAQFKNLDKSRKERGVPNLLPLKKHERNHLIDVSSFRLSKTERGYLSLGLSKVLLHAIIAGILMFVDFGLYWLLMKIQEHGDVQIETSGQGSTDVDIGGTGIFAQLVRILFTEGFQASTSFNTTLDTTVCLPEPIKPNYNLAIAISFLYGFAIIMVLSQAYAQRLLRYIAAYYYPEREVERVAYLYGRTLGKRQTLKKMLRDAVRSRKKEKDANDRISITSYLALRLPCCKSLFTMCGVKQTQCLGCSSPDDGLLVYCSDRDCDGVYCEECARSLQGKCSLCDDFIKMGNTSLEAEHEF